MDRTANHQIALAQIRDILGLPAGTSPAAIVAKVRALQFAAAVPGAVLPDQQAQLAKRGAGGSPAADLRPSVRVPL